MVCISFFVFLHLQHHDATCRDEQNPDNHLGIDWLFQKKKRQADDEHHTQFVNRCNTRHVAHLQCLEKNSHDDPVAAPDKIRNSHIWPGYK